MFFLHQVFFDDVSALFIGQAVDSFKRFGNTFAVFGMRPMERAFSAFLQSAIPFHDLALTAACMDVKREAINVRHASKLTLVARATHVFRNQYSAQMADRAGSLFVTAHSIRPFRAASMSAGVGIEANSMSFS